MRIFDRIRKIIILLFIFVSFQSQAALITIPDANFRAWLVANYPSCMIGAPGSEQLDTTCPDLSTTTSINVDGEGIADLEGIQYFVNLQLLNCDNNMLTTLPTLPNTLTLLVCRNNVLTSIPSLPSSLIRLFCSNNNLTSLPTLPSNLLELSCGFNPLASLPTLPTTLEELSFRDAALTNLPTLPNSLIELNCRNNSLTSLPAIPASLEDLRCGNNQLTSLPSLPVVNSLFLMLCDDNQLDYGDLEPYISVPLLLADPQDNFEISPNTFCSPVGGSFSIDGTVGGSANLYEWFKDGTSLGPPSSNPTLTVSSVALGDAGTYHVVVTSTFGFSSFTLPSIRSEDVVVTTTPCALPISLLSFEAEALSDRTVKLTWITASEQNNAFFTLEKSTNALDFQAFQVIDGAGNSTEVNTYETVDKEPFEGVTYYRLKQTDFDGSFQYHNIVSVLIEENATLSVYPNPVVDWLRIESSSPCKVRLLNAQGKLLKILELTSSKESISLQDLSSGIYFLSIYTKNGVESYKIIKK